VYLTLSKLLDHQDFIYISRILLVAYRTIFHLFLALILGKTQNTTLISTIMHCKLSIPTLLSQITEVYTPNLVATLNKEYDIKIARTKGGFIWHSHPDTDEFFYILSGSLTIEIEIEGGEREDVVLGQGDIFVVPRGVRHRPVGNAEIMLIERVGVVNTGDAETSEMTKQVVDAKV